MVAMYGKKLLRDMEGNGRSNSVPIIVIESEPLVRSRFSQNSVSNLDSDPDSKGKTFDPGFKRKNLFTDPESLNTDPDPKNDELGITVRPDEDNIQETEPNSGENTESVIEIARVEFSDVKLQFSDEIDSCGVGIKSNADKLMETISTSTTEMNYLSPDDGKDPSQSSSEHDNNSSNESEGLITKARKKSVSLSVKEMFDDSNLISKLSLPHHVNASRRQSASGFFFFEKVSLLHTDEYI